MDAWKPVFEEASAICAAGPIGQEEQYDQCANYIQEFWRTPVADDDLIEHMAATPNLFSVTQISDAIMRRHMEQPQNYDLSEMELVYTRLLYHAFDTSKPYTFPVRSIMIRTSMRVIHCHAFELLFLFEELGGAYNTLVEYATVIPLHSIFFKCLEELFYEFSTAVPRYGKFAFDFVTRCDMNFHSLLVPHIMPHALNLLDRLNFEDYPFHAEVESSLTSFLAAVKLVIYWREEDDLPALLSPLMTYDQYDTFLGRLRDKLFFLFERCQEDENISLEILNIICRISNSIGPIIDATRGGFYLQLQQDLATLTNDTTLARYREGVLSVLMVIAVRGACASQKFNVIIPVVLNVLSILEADCDHLLFFIHTTCTQPVEFLRHYERTMKTVSSEYNVPGAQDYCYRIFRSLFQQLTTTDIEDHEVFERVVHVTACAGLTKIADVTNYITTLFDSTIHFQEQISDIEYFRRMRAVLAVIHSVGSYIFDSLPTRNSIIAEYWEQYPHRFLNDNSIYLGCYDGAVRQQLLPETNQIDPVGRFTTYSMFLFGKIFSVVPDAAPYPPMMESMIFYVTQALSNYLQIIRFNADEEPADGREPSRPFILPNDSDFTSFAASVFRALVTVLATPMANEVVHPAAANCLRIMAQNGYFAHVLDVVKEVICHLPEVAMPLSLYSTVCYVYYDAQERYQLDNNFTELFWLAQHVGSGGIERSLDQMNLDQLSTMIQFYTGIAEVYLLFKPAGISQPLIHFHDAIIRILPEHIMNSIFADKVLVMIDQFSKVWDHLETSYIRSYLTTFFESLRIVMSAYEPYWAERDASTTDVGNYDILVRLLVSLKNVLLRCTEPEVAIIGEMGVYVAVNHLNSIRIAVPDIQTPFIEYWDYLVDCTGGIDCLSRIALQTDWVRPFIHNCITDRYGPMVTNSALLFFHKLKLDEDTEADNPEWVAYVKRMLPLFFYTTLSNITDEDNYVAGCAILYRFYVDAFDCFIQFANELANAQRTDQHKNDVLEAFNRIDNIKSKGDFRDKLTTFSKNVSRILVLPPEMTHYCG